MNRLLIEYAVTTAERLVMEARIDAPSNNATAKLLGMNRRTVDRTVARVLDRAADAGYDDRPSHANTLILDIETAPLVAYLWSMWQNGTNLGALESQSYVLSWAAKWLDEDQVMSDALCNNDDYVPGTEDDTRMIQGIWELIDQADIVVAHNGDRFDIKRLNTRFVMNGLPRPTPYKSVDTLKIVKRNFAFDSNKLENLLQQFFGYGKNDAGGMETWIACLKGDREAWEKMISYNESDVTKLQELYLKIRSWDHLHPSIATHASPRSVPACTACGSVDVSPTGTTYKTGVSVFPVHRCNDCGNLMRERKSIVKPEQRDALLVGVK